MATRKQPEPDINPNDFDIPPAEIAQEVRVLRAEIRRAFASAPEAAEYWRLRITTEAAKIRATQAHEQPAHSGQ